MYYFIINPHSRSGYGCQVWKKVEKHLIRESIPYYAFLTERPGQATEYAEQLTKGCKESRVIVVVGGDGTLNEVLDGLCFCSTLTLGYIPAGTGSDLARSLRISKSPQKALRRILHPKYFKQLDYGVITYGDDVIRHRRFMVSSGIGMDATVCHELLYSKLKNVMNRLHLRKLAYIFIGISQFLKARPVKGYILLDGIRRVEFNHIYFISIHLHPYEGGGFRFAPKADPSDGLLDVSVVSQSSKWELFPVMVRALMKRSHNKGLRTYPCREVQIHVDRPLAVHADGESCQYQKDIDLCCIEKKVRLIV